MSSRDYSRQSPSPRYTNLIRQYQQLHLEGEKSTDLTPEETFPGISLMKQVERIKRLVDVTDAKTLLDYGAGKGMQYELGRVDIEKNGEHRQLMVKEYWGVDEIVCYDPAYIPFSNLPARKFDAVICTDVLEHCPEQDIPWILDEMFYYANKFVFALAACYPAKKQLPDGENAHCTIKSAEWWNDMTNRVLEKYPHLLCELWTISDMQMDDGKIKRVEQKISNED